MKIWGFVLVCIVCYGGPSPCAAQFGATPSDLRQVEALSGRVLTPDKKPVAGALLSCVGHEKQVDKTIATLATTRSDTQGRYHFDLAAIHKNGSQVRGVLVEAPGWGLTVAKIYTATFQGQESQAGVLSELPGRNTTVEKVDAAKDLTRDIQLLPATTLRLTFVDDNGNFVPDVSVRLTSVAEPLRQAFGAPSAAALLPRETQWTARSGADGSCTFSALPQGYTAGLNVEDARYAPVHQGGFAFFGNVRVRLDNRPLTAEAPLIMEKPAAIRGRVIFAPSGKPLGGARIDLVPHNSSRSGEAVTDEQGEYHIGNLPSGRYDIYFQPEGALKSEWISRGRKGIVLKAGQELSGQNVTLETGVVVKGRVLSEQGGEPVAKAMVYIDGNLGGETAADGSFQVRVPGGKHQIRVYTVWGGLYAPSGAPTIRVKNEKLHGDLNGWNFTSADEQTLELEFRLPPKVKPHPVEVTVVDSTGAPVEGAIVVPGLLSRVEAPVGKGLKWPKTDAAGHFTLEAHWMESTKLLRAFKDTSATPQAVRIQGDKVTLRLAENVIPSLRGLVLDENGGPIAGEIEVMADEEPNWALCSASTDKAGHYTIKNLWPDLTYRVRGKAKGRIPATTSDFRIRGGVANDAPTLKLTKATGFVAGRVVNLKNQPVAGASVECQGRDTAWQTVITDADGRFHFEGVMPELLNIVVNKDYRLAEERTFGFAPAGTHFRLSQSAEAGRADVDFKIRHF